MYIFRRDVPVSSKCISLGEKEAMKRQILLRLTYFLINKHNTRNVRNLYVISKLKAFVFFGAPEK